MKKIFYLTCLFLFAAILANSNAAAFNQNRTRDRLTTLRNWQLMEDFDLSPEKSQKVFSILKKFDDQRVKLIHQRQSLLAELRSAVDSGTLQREKLEKLMQKLSKTGIQLARIPENERRALAVVFTPGEQARYILFVNDFAKDMSRAIRDKRKPRHERRF